MTIAGSRVAIIGGSITGCAAASDGRVEETPDWSAMTPEDFDTWTKATLAGEKLYFYGNADESPDKVGTHGGTND